MSLKSKSSLWKCRKIAMCTKWNFVILVKASSKFVFHLILIGKVFNVTKVFLPLDATFEQPSAAGIPLKFMLQSVLFMHVNSNVKTAMETKFFLFPFQASLTGKLNSRFVNESSAVFYLQFVSQFLSLISKPQNEIGQRIMVHLKKRCFWPAAKNSV